MPHQLIQNQVTLAIAKIIKGIGYDKANQIVLTSLTELFENILTNIGRNFNFYKFFNEYVENELAFSLNSIRDLHVDDLCTLNFSHDNCQNSKLAFFAIKDYFGLNIESIFDMLGLLRNFKIKRNIDMRLRKVECLRII